MAVYVDKTGRSQYSINPHLCLVLRRVAYLRSFSERIPILCGLILPLYVARMLNLAISHFPKSAHIYHSPYTQHVALERESSRAALQPVSFGTCLDGPADSSAASYVGAPHNVALQNAPVNSYNSFFEDDCSSFPLVFPSLCHRLWLIFLKDSILTPLRKVALVTVIHLTTALYLSVPPVRAKRGLHSKSYCMASKVTP